MAQQRIQIDPQLQAPELQPYASPTANQPLINQESLKLINDFAGLSQSIAEFGRTYMRATEEESATRAKSGALSVADQINQLPVGEGKESIAEADARIRAEEDRLIREGKLERRDAPNFRKFSWQLRGRAVADKFRNAVESRLHEATTLIDAQGNSVNPISIDTIIDQEWQKVSKDASFENYYARAEADIVRLETQSKYREQAASELSKAREKQALNDAASNWTRAIRELATADPNGNKDQAIQRLESSIENSYWGKISESRSMVVASAIEVAGNLAADDRVDASGTIIPGSGADEALELLETIRNVKVNGKRLEDDGSVNEKLIAEVNRLRDVRAKAIDEHNNRISARLNVASIKSSEEYAEAIRKAFAEGKTEDQLYAIVDGIASKYGEFAEHVREHGRSWVRGYQQEQQASSSATKELMLKVGQRTLTHADVRAALDSGLITSQQAIEFNGEADKIVTLSEKAQQGGMAGYKSFVAALRSSYGLTDNNHELIFNAIDKNAEERLADIAGQKLPAEQAAKEVEKVHAEVQAKVETYRNDYNLKLRAYNERLVDAQARGRFDTKLIDEGVASGLITPADAIKFTNELRAATDITKYTQSPEVGRALAAIGEGLEAGDYIVDSQTHTMYLAKLGEFRDGLPALIRKVQSETPDAAAIPQAWADALSKYTVEFSAKAAEDFEKMGAVPPTGPEAAPAKEGDTTPMAPTVQMPLRRGQDSAKAWGSIVKDGKQPEDVYPAVPRTPYVDSDFFDDAVSAISEGAGNWFFDAPTQAELTASGNREAFNVLSGEGTSSALRDEERAQVVSAYILPMIGASVDQVLSGKITFYQSNMIMDGEQLQVAQDDQGNLRIPTDEERAAVSAFFQGKQNELASLKAKLANTTSALAIRTLNTEIAALEQVLSTKSLLGGEGLGGIGGTADLDISLGGPGAVNPYEVPIVGFMELYRSNDDDKKQQMMAALGIKTADEFHMVAAFQENALLPRLGVTGAEAKTVTPEPSPVPPTPPSEPPAKAEAPQAPAKAPAAVKKAKGPAARTEIAQALLDQADNPQAISNALSKGGYSEEDISEFDNWVSSGIRRTGPGFVAKMTRALSHIELQIVKDSADGKVTEDRKRELTNYMVKLRNAKVQDIPNIVESRKASTVKPPTEENRK